MLAVPWLSAIMLAAAQLPAARCPSELFRISNNRSASVVVYEANLGTDGRLDPSEPVRATWVHTDGHREELNFLERTLAYGFEVRSDRWAGCWLVMRARPSRPIRVVEQGGCPRAVLAIAHRPALLRSIAIVAGEGLIPHVDHADLSGVELGTGAEVVERVAGGATPTGRASRPANP
jgi:hypothetical protein